MWNYVQMEDGNWYAVDVTWDDQDISLRLLSCRQANQILLVKPISQTGLLRINKYVFTYPPLE